MWDVNWWRQVAERALKTAAQAGLAFFVVGETMFDQIDWAAVAGGMTVAAIASVLTSIASTPFGPPGTPSLVRDGDADA